MNQSYQRLFTLAFKIDEEKKLNAITVNRFQPEAGDIEISGSGATSIDICAGDGAADPIDVTVNGTSVGANSGWVITDNTTGEILALPPAPPFDLDGAGAGVCDIWYIRYDGDITGLETGENVADLDGCFDLSNAITVNRFQPMAGSISVSGTGETEVGICVDGVGDPLDISVAAPSQGEFSGWVITDNTDGTILALPPGPPFDLDGAGPGVCDIWYVRYDGALTGLEVGENVADVEGCFDLSNPVTVYRQEADAGTVALADGSNSVSICAGDGIGDPLEIVPEGYSDFLSYRYVITDNSADNTILAISDSNIIDLEGAGEGICLIWGWSYTGLNPDDFIGEPAVVLEQETCSDLTSIFVEVNRLTGGDCEILALTDQAVLDFQMAPNPATDQVQIQLAQAANLEVQVYDLLGRTVKAEQFDTTTRARLQVAELPAGTYLIRMTDPNSGRTATSRLVKR